MKNVELRSVKDYNADPSISPNVKFRGRDNQYYQMGYVLVYPDTTAQYVRGNKAVAELALKMARHEYSEGYFMGQDDARANKDCNPTKFDMTKESGQQRSKGYVAGFNSEVQQKA